jgi:hypothetical protein
MLPKYLVYQFQNLIYQYTLTLWQNYINCFVNKQLHINKYPFHFKIHMYNLHQIYINKKISIIKSVVINYVNNLDIIKLIYILNYDSTND